jgi:predicted dehydrogenase
MNALSKEKGVATQMGTQLHSTQAYRMLTHFIRDGVIGKTSKVYGWSSKKWGYDSALPTGHDPVPAHVDWNLWIGTSAERPYLNKIYHPGNWRRMTDFGNGTLGDMGVHIFDPVLSSLNLGQPIKSITKCRAFNGYSHPSGNTVEYEFVGSEYTDSNVIFTWFDGSHTPNQNTEIADLQLPDERKLPSQGAMFIGENGQRILLPHGSGPQFFPSSIKSKLTKPKIAPLNHYHQWVDAAMGNGQKCNVDFDYAETLTTTVLLGVLGNRFPGKELHWDAANMRFTNHNEANQLIHKSYRKAF